MSNKLNELIGKSVNKKNPTQQIKDETLADKLFKNADRALGLLDQDDKIQLKKGSIVKNLTFTFGLDEIDNINEQIERFIKNGKSINKSELIRIGLKLVENADDKELPRLTTLITKHPRGRQS